MRSKSPKTPESGLLSETKKDLSLVRSEAQAASVLARKANLEEKRVIMDTHSASVLMKIAKSLDEEALELLTAKERATIYGILHDKTFGKEREAAPISAIQINIKTIGSSTVEDEPLQIRANPASNADPS